MNIRQASPSDAKAIAQLLVNSWRYAYQGIIDDKLLANLSVDSRASGWCNHLEAGANVFVLGESGRIVGVVEITKFRHSLEEFQEFGEIPVIYLEPEYMGQGYGAMLLTCAMDNLRALGFFHIAIWVLEGNYRAKNFYSKHGYNFAGVTKHNTGLGLIEQLYTRSFRLS